MANIENYIKGLLSDVGLLDNVRRGRDNIVSFSEGIKGLLDFGDTDQPVNTMDNIIDRTMKEEGGYQKSREDEGNFIDGRLIGTNYGITPKAWKEYTGISPEDITSETIKNITPEQAKEFYRYKGTREFKLDRYPEKLRPQIFDIMANFGYTGGMKVLQKAAGVDRDGRYGPKTAKALKEVTNNKLAQARWDSYSEEKKKQNPGWKKRTFSFAGE